MIGVYLEHRVPPSSKINKQEIRHQFSARVTWPSGSIGQLYKSLTIVGSGRNVREEIQELFLLNGTCCASCLMGVPCLMVFTMEGQVTNCGNYFQVLHNHNVEVSRQQSLQDRPMYLCSLNSLNIIAMYIYIHIYIYIIYVYNYIHIHVRANIETAPVGSQLSIPFRSMSMIMKRNCSIWAMRCRTRHLASQWLQKNSCYE